MSSVRAGYLGLTLLMSTVCLAGAAAGQGLAVPRVPAPQRPAGPAPVLQPVSQDPATRRLTRVPAPIGQSGRVEDLYSGSYALLVGVSQYDTRSWASLGSVTSELNDLQTALHELGFDQVERLTNPTGAELRRGVEAFIAKYGYKTDARLLFFFSGHGFTLDGGRRGYFIPRDSPDPLENEERFRSVALSMDQVATWARDLTARHAMFAFDSCFSGTIFRTKERTVPAPVTALTAKKVREFLSAGDANEPVPARSVFTPMFTRAVRGAADLNRDGFVTGTELGNWVQGQVIAYGTKQTPQFGKLRDPEFDEGDLVFAVPLAPAPPTPLVAPVVGPANTSDTELTRREELAVWEAVKDSNSVAVFQDYVRQYPTGRFRAAAEDRIARLRPVPAPVPTPAPAPAPPPVRTPSVDVAPVPAPPPARSPVAAPISPFKLSAEKLVTADSRDLVSDCTLGHGAACRQLAVNYTYGWSGVKRDYKQAIKYHQLACDSGFAPGCGDLGLMYYLGQGVRSDYAEALRLYQRGCEASDGNSCQWWGQMFREGNGVSRDFARAFSLFQQACDLGSSFLGCQSLAEAYELGRGVTADRGRALELYQRSCQAGSKDSCAAAKRVGG